MHEKTWQFTITSDGMIDVLKQSIADAGGEVVDIILGRPHLFIITGNQDDFAAICDAADQCGATNLGEMPKKEIIIVD